MKVPGLIRDDRTGGVSHTKFWSNIAYAAMTAAFLRAAFTGHLDDGLMFSYGAVVAGSHVATNLVNRKWGKGADLGAQVP